MQVEEPSRPFPGNELLLRRSKTLPARPLQPMRARQFQSTTGNRTDFPQGQGAIQIGWRDPELGERKPHDIGFAKGKRNNNVTHKIDGVVDGEHDNINR